MNPIEKANNTELNCKLSPDKLQTSQPAKENAAQSSLKQLLQNDNIDVEKLKSLLRKKTTNIRNISIIAHVDHGKTSLVDSLVSHNNIINPRLAGSIRYMDSLPDEQERLITMKTSSISLLYNDKCNDAYYINVIDSPGHIDFSSEIFTALSVCEGALLVIDVVEGICSQTISVLKQAWNENIRLILVFNKLDRLITEIKLTPTETYEHLYMLMMKINTIMSSLLNSEINLLKETKTKIELDKYLEDREKEMYFSPEKGNVIFASAIDGWAFSLDVFADLLTDKLKVDRDVLINNMWGNNYFNNRTKEFEKEPVSEKSKPAFIELVLDSIYKIYKIICFEKDKAKIDKVTETLKIQIPNSDYSYLKKEPKYLLRTLMRQWLPIAYTVFEMVVGKLPSPVVRFSHQIKRYFQGMNGAIENPKTMTNLANTNNINDCDNVSISSFTNNSITTHGVNDLFQDIFGFSKDDLDKIGEKDLQQTKCLAHILKMINIPVKNCPSYHKFKQNQLLYNQSGNIDERMDTLNQDYITVPFARNFSGVIQKNKEYYLISPKFKTKSNNNNNTGNSNSVSSGYEVTKVVFSNLFCFMGEHLEEVNEVYPGVIFSVVGIEDYVFKSALISESPNFPVSNFGYNFCPLIKVSLITEQTKDMPKLIAGLKSINRSDPAIDYYVQNNGEHILETLGEVHLERIVKDLEDRLCKCKLIVSKYN